MTLLKRLKNTIKYLNDRIVSFEHEASLYNQEVLGVSRDTQFAIDQRQHIFGEISAMKLIKMELEDIVERTENGI